MEKKEINANMGLFPMPITLLGADVSGKSNFMPIAFLARVNYQPFIIALGVNRHHYTTEGIKENMTFSINFPTSDMVEKVDYCGLVSGRNVDKSDLFETFYGKLENAPMIKDCSVCLEFKVTDIIEQPTNYLILGEVVAAWSDDEYLTDGKPDPAKMEPFALTMPDNSYWGLGERLGQAWNIGKKLKSKG